MDSETEELYLMKLQEQIEDEDKITTCISIAYDFNISINDAKKLITKYVEDHRQLNPNNLALTYNLGGKLKNNEFGCFLVKEENLDATKKLFELISSQDIYSVQKSKDLDFNFIALANKREDNIDEKPLLGSVVGKNCIKRTLPVKEYEQPQKQSSSQKSRTVEPKIESENKTNEPSVSKETAQSAVLKPKASKKGNIASFFSKIQPKSSSTLESENEKSQTTKGDKSSKPNEEINKSSKPIKDMPHNGTEKTNEDDENCKKLSTNNSAEKIEVDDFKTKETKTVDSTKKNKKRQMKDKKDSEKPAKKRKRIQDRYDSDSSDLFEDENISDFIEASDPEPEPVPVKKLAPRNKVKRAVDKTYVDDEGFIVTKTEYVYETAPEDEKEVELLAAEVKPKLAIQKKSSTEFENEIPAKVKSKGKNKKAVSGKQPTLLNFFKKC